MHFLTFRRFVPPRVANEKGVPEILTTCNTVTFTPSQQTGRPLLEKKVLCLLNQLVFFLRQTHVHIVEPAVQRWQHCTFARVARYNTAARDRTRGEA